MFMDVTQKDSNPMPQTQPEPDPNLENFDKHDRDQIRNPLCLVLGRNEI